jgi:hypothetical protein
MTKNPNDDLLALREATLANRRKTLEAEARDIHEYLAETRETALDYLKNNDLESARFSDENAIALENELNTKLIELQNAGGIPASQSEAKREWLARRPDLINQQTIQAAGAAHHYITQAMGVRDDSREYYELMGHAVEPAAYQPTPTPDDICRELNLNPKTYNKNVHELQRRKAAGDYRDK